LAESWQRVKANGGSAGVDGVTCEGIEQEGVDKFLNGLSEELRQQTYQPSAVKRVWIPKSNGSKRPLGIPKLLSYYLFTVYVRDVSDIFQISTK
jgi:retron-type reverse transcriptase